MDYINYVKQSPMMGIIGFGGGATSLGRFAGGVQAAGPYNGDRGIVAAGGGGGLTNQISYTTISTSGSWSDFGDLAAALYAPNGVAGGDGELGSVQASRVVFAGGDSTGSHTVVNTMQYITTSSTGNTSDFGDLTAAKKAAAGTASNGWRSIYAGGATPGAIDNIDYWATMTTGNASNFGSLEENEQSGDDGGVSNGTNGFIMGPYSEDRIDTYVIATTGNATEFGTMASGTGRNKTAAGSNQTYGIKTGNGNEFNIDRITMATAGNSTDIGDLTNNRWGSAGSSNMTYLLIVGGYDDGSNISSTEYKAFATTGNASNFGNLNYTKRGIAGTSGAAS